MTRPGPADAGTELGSAAHPAIRLQTVSKRYGEVVALEEINLEIGRGEFFTLLGPSGSGKSTLLQLIGGFERPTTGRIFLGGEDVTDLPANRRATNTVFQSLALFPHMTVAQNVEYGLRVQGLGAAERAAKRKAMLSVVGLEGLDNRPIHQLSGGQRQRVALARALVLEPQVLLLDEPLTGLDEKLRQQMQVEIKRLHQRLNATFLSVTHNQEEALLMSDRIAVLRDGRIEQVGVPRDIYERPINLFVADFMGAENLIVPATPPAYVNGEVGSDGSKRARFRIGEVEVSALAPPHVTLAAPVVGVVRPESIALGAGADQLSNRVPAKVIGHAYKGREAVVELELPDGQRMRAVHRLAINLPAIGEGVTIGWADADMRLLPTEARAASEPVIH